MGDIMRKGHVFITILQFVFIILFISCKDKNNEVITVENINNINNDLSGEIGDDVEFNEESICKIHNQKMYKENRIIIIYGLIAIGPYNEYNERKEKYFPNCIKTELGGCVFDANKLWRSLPYSYYVCKLRITGR